MHNLTDILVFLTAALLVLTKWFDCISTSRQIRFIGQEQNGMARKLMRKIGIKPAIWLIFLIHLLIVALSMWILYEYYDKALWKWIFIFIGICISVVQAAVGLSNHRGQLNAISRLVLKWMRR